MEKTLWQRLNKPIVGLSPMDGVTEVVYRSIQKKYGNPDLIYTEFTSVEGICHNAQKLLRDFSYTEEQRPVIAQVFGVTPEYYRQTAVLLCELGFDGIDINMGCPAKSMHKQGSGANLINTPELAQEIVRQTKQGIEDYYNGMRSKDCPDISPRIVKEVEARAKLVQNRPTKIGLSVKTRVGFSDPVTKTWIKTLLETGVEAIALHGRTLKQQYSGEASWEEIGKAVKIAQGSGTLILGNGDVNSHQEALEKIDKYGVDGVLIGRASFGNPFVFLPEGITPSKSIFEIALEHSQLYEKEYSDQERNKFLPMRKHLGWYVKGIDQAKQVRMELFRAESSVDVERIFKKYELI
jgi:nifR3 family TIM-barrel protein